MPNFQLYLVSIIEKIKSYSLLSPNSLPWKTMICLGFFFFFLVIFFSTMKTLNSRDIIFYWEVVYMWLKKGRKENKTPTCETPLCVASCTPQMHRRPRSGVIAELLGITDPLTQNPQFSKSHGWFTWVLTFESLLTVKQSSTLILDLITDS